MIAVRRRTGWWGIAFVALLAVQAAMVSLPTGSESGQQIKAFYSAHRQIIVLQQLMGVITLIAFVAFALSALAARVRFWLLTGTVLIMVMELATNIVPLGIALANPSVGAAHTFTVIEDLADAGLFLAIGVFAVAATSQEVLWLRALGLVVAVVSIVRAVLNPLRIDALDQVAPLAFILLVLVLAVRIILGKGTAVASRPVAP